MSQQLSHEIMKGPPNGIVDWLKTIREFNEESLETLPNTACPPSSHGSYWKHIAKYSPHGLLSLWIPPWLEVSRFMRMWKTTCADILQKTSKLAQSFKYISKVGIALNYEELFCTNSIRFSRWKHCCRPQVVIVFHKIHLLAHIEERW